jgi:hypothetical protein
LTTIINRNKLNIQSLDTGLDTAFKNNQATVSVLKDAANADKTGPRGAEAAFGKWLTVCKELNQDVLLSSITISSFHIAKTESVGIGDCCDCCWVRWNG